MEELRAFMHQLVLDTSLRQAAARVGLGHEALRKFISGQTERPHERSRRAMGELYLDSQRSRVAEQGAIPTAGQLKLLLPRGLEHAEAEIRAVFQALEQGQKPPAATAELERWLLRRLREEYAAEPRWGTRRRRKG